MPRSLAEHLADLPDPRDPRGRTYPLVGLLQLAVLGLLAGHTTLVAISHFGRTRGQSLAHTLGFRNAIMPCPNTLANLFRVLDADRLDALLAAWLAERGLPHDASVAIDGKVLRGSKDGDVPGLHLIAAYVPRELHSFPKLEAQQLAERVAYFQILLPGPFEVWPWRRGGILGIPANLPPR